MLQLRLLREVNPVGKIQENSAWNSQAQENKGG